MRFRYALSTRTSSLLLLEVFSSEERLAKSWVELATTLIGESVTTQCSAVNLEAGDLRARLRC